MIIIIETIAENPYFIFIGTIASIIGLILTIAVALKTKSISKQLNEMRIKKRYNETKTLYNAELKAALKSILDDEVTQPSFIKQLLQTVREYENLYSDLLSLRDKFHIYRLKKELEKPNSKINFNLVTNDITHLTARLVITEE